ncbi:MAG: hypothetical protein JXA67_04830 [Micromonosporaceae bacterium]|nr:hypothetical protein [Micromonosporaceae bacterium]
MSDLVKRLSMTDRLVTVGGPSPSLEELRQRVTDLGYVFIKFPDTRGGTDLGVHVDAAATDLSTADFAAGSGSAHIEGTLTLDYVKVRCVCDLDLASLSGTGRLVADPANA